MSGLICELRKILNVSKSLQYFKITKNLLNKIVTWISSLLN